MDPFAYISSYFPDQRDDSGNKVQFPGTIDGYPVRTDEKLNITDEEYVNTPIRHDAHTKVFDLSKPEELTEYNSVIDKIAKGICILRYEKVEYDKDTKNWRILTQWFSVYGDPSQSKSVL